MSQDRIDYQKKIEDGMFSRNIRADILDEFDLQDLLADQRFKKMMADAVEGDSWEEYKKDEKNHILLESDLHRARETVDEDGVRTIKTQKIANKGDLDISAMKKAFKRHGRALDLNTFNFNELLDDVPEDEFDIDEVKEEFKNLITEIATDVRVALELASGERNLKADTTWNPLLTYDTAGTCPSCGDLFPLNRRISNNKVLVRKITKMFAEQEKLLPRDWRQKNSEKRLFSRSNREEEVVQNGERTKIKKIKLDWEYFRDALENSDVKFKQESGKMKRKEMLRLNEVNSDWGKIAAGLILCDRRSLKCPHKSCQENLWGFSLDPHSPFHKISYEATRVILEQTVGKPTARAPLSMLGFSGENSVDLRMGKLGKQNDEEKDADTKTPYRKEDKRLIAEAVLSATTVLGDIKLKTDGTLTFDGVGIDEIVVNQSDSEKAAKVYTTPNHNIVTKLAKVIERVRPVEAFVLDNRDVAEHKQWAARCAGQVLHAIHQSGVLFKVEKTGSWTYSASKTSNHATNLITLNEDIQDKVTSERFVKPSQNGDIIYNQLESMLSKETTPPMVCEPTPRTLQKDSPGGMLTKAGQKRYPLVTQAPQYNHFNQNRFIPSSEAISSINVLQSTEWAVNLDMADLAKETIKKHVKDEILDKFKIRKAYEIRRHYFQNAEGTPILLANGDAKVSKIGKEFANRDQAEDYISGQDTSSETCSQKKQNRMRHDHWKEQIHEVLYIDFDGVKPPVTFGQVNSWWNTFDFIERLKKNYPDTKFWHPWHFDWRGRIMPVSTMLSPQNDDFARGLITFANSEQISETGRKWVGRVIAGMYRGQPIPNSIQGDKRITLEGLMAKLESKTFEAFDEVSSHEAFQDMMRLISTDPMKHFDCWGKGDVFRTKAEGLQRIALTKEFVSILDQGDTAFTRLPINLDASSSIYQHASALMLDSSMASKVNVLPNDSGRPSDIYVEVVEHLKSAWTGNPFKSFEINRTFEDSDKKSRKVTFTVEGLDDEIAELLKESVLTRNMAKKPVMTIGYGASPQSMVSALLTDNQEENGNLGGLNAYSLGENWPTVIEDPSDMDKRQYRYLMTAHPSSTLGRICNELGIPNHFHWLIAQKVISGFTKSIEEVLPGYKKMKSSLSGLCAQNLEHKFNTSPEIKAAWSLYRNLEGNQNADEKSLKKEFMQSKEFLKLSGGLVWTVKDGCEVRNVYFEDPVMDSITAWGGMDNATKTIRTIARDSLPEESRYLISLDNLEPIDFQELDGLIDEDIFNKLKSHEAEKLLRLVSSLNNSDYSSDSINLDTFVVDWSKLAQDLEVGDSLEDINNHDMDDEHSPLAKIISEVRKYSGNFNVTFSRNLLSNDRDLSAERRGIAPNFIHSLDACHMRLFATAMARNGVTDIWSVHDAFGCHPNHIEDLRYIVNKTFVEVHAADENGRGILAKLYYEITGKELEVGDMDLSDISKLVDGQLLSKYLVS